MGGSAFPDLGKLFFCCAQFAGLVYRVLGLPVEVAQGAFKGGPAVHGVLIRLDQVVELPGVLIAQFLFLRCRAFSNPRQVFLGCAQLISLFQGVFRLPRHIAQRGAELGPAINRILVGLHEVAQLSGVFFP